MGTDKTALFIERYRQRAITCSHLKNRILFAIFFNKKFNQCFGITFSLIFGSCRNVLDFKYAFSFIGYDTLAFDSVIVKHIHRAMVEVTVYHILLLMEKERQELLDLHCEATVDGYTDFIFINRFGQPQHQATLNKAIRRIIRDCNDEQLLKDENAEVLLPHFSCHSLRHTFTTRMCEAGVNVKVIQDTLGHKDISTTLNIYTDVTKELRKSEFEGLDSYFKNEYNKVSV